jgi:hypothetical protein
MADSMKTCANCGNVQAAGDFCEKCGTRMPAGENAPRSPGAGPAGVAAAAPPPYTPPPYTAAPQGQAGPQYGGGSGYPDYNYGRGKGFFGRLFDFSFHEFITPSIIKVLFIISMVVIVLGFVGGLIFGFMQGAVAGVLFLIGGLVYSFLMLLYVRVMLELFVVFFRIHDNTSTIAKNKR